MRLCNRDYFVRRAIAAALVTSFVGLGAALAANMQFSAELDPAPFETATRATVQGIGDVTASLAGNQLSISGHFSGLSSNATAVHLKMGLAEGVPGDAVGDLTATPGTAGQISGSVKLNAKQIAALRARSVYVEIDSVKAPDGNLRGWLEAPAP